MMRFIGSVDEAGYFESPDTDSTPNEANTTMSDKDLLVPHDLFTEDIPDGVLDDEDLIEIREKSERGLVPITIFVPFRATDEPNILCVVLEDEEAGRGSKFHCHRYMRQLNGDWEVSYDGQGVGYSKGLKWISSPRAL